MPFKRNITHSDGLNFWQCICSGVIRLIRLACNGAAVISDLSVLCGDSSALRGGASVIQSQHLAQTRSAAMATQAAFHRLMRHG